MKTLNDILTNTSELYFPVRGQNGYAGEQDGSHVIYGLFYVWSREKAKEIILPDFVKLNWAEYKPGTGWNGAIGYWSNQEMTDQDEGILNESCDFIDWE